MDSFPLYPSSVGRGYRKYAQYVVETNQIRFYKTKTVTKYTVDMHAI